MKTIYTYGYQGKKTEDVQSHLTRLGAVLIDTRYSPRSRNPVWNGKRLQQTFGGHYLHLPELGNVNYNNDGPIQIADLEAGGAKVAAMMETAPVILLCVCADVNTCHRKVVADVLAQQYGWQVEHL